MFILITIIFIAFMGGGANQGMGIGMDDMLLWGLFWSYVVGNVGGTS
jgi:hypothetical protein